MNMKLYQIWKCFSQHVTAVTVIFAGTLSISAAEWISNDGRTIEATLLRLEGENVIL